MPNFLQIEWDQKLERACRAVVKLARAEDLDEQQDLTTVALVPADQRGAATVVSRESGVAAGLASAEIVLEEFQADLRVTSQMSDGDQFAAGTSLLSLGGNVRDLLTAERTLLNLLSRLMGIATLANRYATELSGTKAHIYDTRKTTPGWRRLEKYAIRCGGARNHRCGLYDAILIKDNHLAQRGTDATDVASAVQEVYNFLEKSNLSQIPVEVEVDSLDQLMDVLPAKPHIVLLDNMSTGMLYQAVQLRDKIAPQVELEASGGIQFEDLRKIAATGVERISVGALTHSARSLDIGLDWLV